ncbi:Ig-like domain-containing protein [Clostridium intestinale]|uniref:Ig-like domain-containing protein n=1 Tax=Clostridium intestinale TaxID=36845 RepID=UPI0028ED930F|nr:Ig-like domain-containing protein [Clostridium intestinale]
MIEIKRKVIECLLIVLCLSTFMADNVQAAEKTTTKSVTATVSKSLEKIMHVDEPTANLATGGNIRVRGWALNQSGIKEVKIYAQDKYLGNASIGKSRPDVKAAYSQYTDADKSGYEYVIDTASLGKGAKTIKVEAVGKDGTSQTYSVKVNIGDLKPLMNIDEPSANLTTGGNIKVRGWALNQSGIKEVKIYAQDKYLGNASLGKSRLDVKNVYPQYIDSDKSGYEYVIDTASLGTGTKTIKVQAVGKDGTSQTYSVKVNLSKLAPIMNVDEPKANLTANGNIKVRGWALNSSGIKEVRIYAEEKYVGSASLGKSRPDVKNAYSVYPNADKSGYEYTINTSDIEVGGNTIKVQAIGNDGTSQTYSVKINKPSPLMSIDEPTLNSTAGGNIKVRGWALNASEVKEVKVYVDDAYVGSAALGKSRADVKKAFPQYINADKSGYEYTVNTLTIKPGTKTIKVQAIGKDGTSQTYTTKVNLNKPNPITHIDEPSVNSTVTGKIKVRGWALNASEIKEIKVYMDNKYMTNAAIEKSRPDVQRAYPKYINAAESGYECTIDTSSIKEGTAAIKVLAIGKDGTQSEVSINVKVYNSSVEYYTYSKSLNDYVDIQAAKKPLIQDSYTGLWRYATEDEIYDYMNPESFRNDSIRKYMFLNLNYSNGIYASQLNKALEGKGVLEGKGQAFLDAGKRANVNPIYLVAHALLETGNGTSKLSNGSITVKEIHGEFGNIKSDVKNVSAKKIYNVYGIGALDQGADLWGSEKAYSEGWFTIEDAIIGGAKWIGDGYVNSTTFKQNTLYKMRWDFSTDEMWHQYATDVAWAYKQTVQIKNIIDCMDNPVIHLEIPKFKN